MTTTEETIEAIRALTRFKENWDHFGGDPINPRSIAKAVAVVSACFDEDTPKPSVVPMSNGGVQLEWHTCGIDCEVYVSRSGHVSCYVASPGAIDANSPLVVTVNKILRRSLHGSNRGHWPSTKE